MYLMWRKVSWSFKDFVVMFTIRIIRGNADPFDLAEEQRKGESARGRANKAYSSST